MNKYSKYNSRGRVELEKRDGSTYTREAQYIRGYGMVPCSKKLLNNYTRIPENSNW